MTAPLLEVRALAKRFPLGQGRAVHAVDGVDFAMARGEILGLVGESGSGKSTIGRLIARLAAPDSGTIRFAGEDLASLPSHKMRAMRARLQIVFQDPWAALNPRLSVRRLIEEPLLLHSGSDAAARRAASARLAERVQLRPDALDRYPVELSGGQLQRVCIARALATGPDLLVLDEPTSSLDLSVRAGILDLLHGLRAEMGTAMLFISHDLATVRLVCDRVLVLYLGRVVEEGPTAELFAAPSHPYTRALLSAQLSPDPRRRRTRLPLSGEIPSVTTRQAGCAFAGRCPQATEECARAVPALRSTGPGRAAACIAVDRNYGSMPGSTP